MRKLIKYIFALIITLSLVHFTKDIIEFSREIIALKDNQLQAKVKEEKMLQPTVKITSLAAGPLGEVAVSSATGFSIGYIPGDNTSIVVTNEHFCNGSDNGIDLLVQDYKTSSLERNGEYLRGRVMVSRADLDLCIVLVAGYIKPVELASYHYEPKPFEQIYVVGAPTGTYPIIIDSYISKVIDRENIALGQMSKKGNDLILISEQVFPGHSGSPVFTKDGEVVGIIFAALKTYGGLAVSVKDIYVMLDSMEQK